MAPPHINPLTSQAKYWTWTIFDYNAVDIVSLESLVARNNNVRYICWGFEVCPHSGRNHLQGYIQLISKKRGSQVQVFLKPACHVEVSRQGWEFNYKYCSKTREADPIPNAAFYQFGTPLKKGKGRRSDLEDVAIAIGAKRSLHSIATEFPVQYIKYHKGIQELRNVLSMPRPEIIENAPRDFITEVHVLWGTTETGKSRFVHDTSTDLYTWSKKATGVWFDGYDNHSEVLFDEFYGDIPFSTMLKLCDRYPLRVPVSGSFVNWRPSKIFICSNGPPSSWWPNANIPVEARAAFYRRITSETQYPLPQ